MLQKRLEQNNKKIELYEVNLENYKKFLTTPEGLSKNPFEKKQNMINILEKAIMELMIKNIYLNNLNNLEINTNKLAN